MIYKLILILAVIIFNSNLIQAQDYVKDGENRLNFANTYFELGAQYTSSFNGYIIGENNIMESVSNSASITPTLNIGGIHFWGHADFYISIPLLQFKLAKNDKSDFTFNQSVVTGARYLPWAYSHNKIRPYIGGSWAVVNFKQGNKENHNQPLYSKNKLVFDAGILYGKNNLMFRLGVNFHPNNKWNYPISKNLFKEVKTPRWGVNIGLIYSMETTRSKDMKSYNDMLNEYPTISSPTLDAIKRGDWFLAIGPSSSFTLSNSTYNKTTYPFLNKKPISNSFIDIAIGYQFNKAGIITSLSYRNPKFTNEGYGVKQTIKKKSVVFEAYKFLTDYSGFTPYIGLNIGFSNIKYNEQSNANNYSESFTSITPGLTIGWDILPGKTQQWFVLRTNLRWIPFEKFSINGIEFSQNQLEYNVIQLVFYPSRYKSVRNK
ncbi:MAG: outer membrane protein W [Crocinitomix sp.]|jgi:outer membrane protein W